MHTRLKHSLMLQSSINSIMFSGIDFGIEIKIDVALKVYHQCGSVTVTTRVPGYSTKRALYTRIANEGAARPERKPLNNINTAEHPRHRPDSPEKQENGNDCRCLEE